MTIRRLSVQLANQIAAGEVVERPCSVVKELLENSVDAKATEIKCFVEGAGRVLIKVSDNGSGIPCDELTLALAPHATSKISCTEDLENILTLGFRGEALASIASVTRLTLTSRTADEADGYRVSCEGPEMEASVIPCPHGVGTTVEARELFFNTPARRRFLRSDRTELNRIRDVFVRCALAHPEIGFELISDQKTILKVKGAQDETQRLKRMAYLAGGEFLKEGAAVRCEDPLLRIDGVVLEAGDATQGGAEKIFLFLNSRPIADRSVTHAVREAYAQFFGSQAAARCVLYLQCDPHEADVNVHPRKDEVRFHSMRAVHDLTVEALLRAFSRFMPQKDDLLGDLEPQPSLTAKSNVESKTLEELLGTVDKGKAQTSLPDFPNGEGMFVSVPREKNSEQEYLSLLAEQHSRQRSFENMISSHAKASMTKLTMDDEVRNIARPSSSSLLCKDDEDTKKTIVALAPQVEETSKLLAHITEHTVLIKRGGRYLIVNVIKLWRQSKASTYAKAVEEEKVAQYKLALPFSLKCSPQLIKALKNSLAKVARCGFEIVVARSQLTVTALPSGMENAELSSCLNRCFSVIASSDELNRGRCPKTLAQCVAETFSAESIDDGKLQKLLDDSSDDLLLSEDVSIDLKVVERALEFERGIE